LSVLNGLNPNSHQQQKRLPFSFPATCVTLVSLFTGMFFCFFLSNFLLGFTSLDILFCCFWFMVFKFKFSLCKDFGFRNGEDKYKVNHFSLPIIKVTYYLYLPACHLCKSDSEFFMCAGQIHRIQSPIASSIRSFNFIPVSFSYFCSLLFLMTWHMWHFTVVIKYT